MNKIKRIAAFTLVLVLSGFFFLIPGSSNPVHAQAASEQSYRKYKTMARGGTPGETITERIDWHRREVVTNRINPGIPGYMSSYNCGVTAGGLVVAWYHHLPHINLIPNHNPGFWFNGVFRWANSTAAVHNMFSNLHTRMGGLGPQGVTIPQFITGLGSYVLSQNHTMSLDSVRANNNELRPSFKTAIANGQPVSLFLYGFNVMGMSGLRSFDGHDTVFFVQYSGAHVMLAYGYHIISYFDENNVMFRQDTYLFVNTGFGGTGDLMRINSHATLDEALVTHIS